MRRQRINRITRHGWDSQIHLLYDGAMLAAGHAPGPFGPKIFIPNEPGFTLMG
jgi:hypothetical protein